jgi:hypothetical protein
MQKVAINTTGIKKHISNFSAEEAIAEFIWNSFDADADNVVFEFNIEKVLGSCSELKISDDGSGIPNDQLKFKFKPYFESRKIVSKNVSLPHGHHGYGRFTFSIFSPKATWETVYEDRAGDKYKYSISIHEDDLVKIIDSEPKKVPTNTKVGTTVTFYELSDISESYINSVIIPFIKYEFAWFLVLYPAKKIAFGDTIINATEILKDKSLVIESEKKSYTSTDDVVFSLNYVQWNKKLHDEYSKIYYIADAKEVFKENTKLNNKSDSFFHSVYVESSYFSEFEFISNENNDVQDLIFPGVKNRKSKTFQFIENEIYQLLKEKRSPFIAKLSKKLVSDYESDGVITPVNDDSSPLEKFENQAIKEIVEELHNIEPKIFSGFNIEQKKTFIGLLSTIISSSDAKNKILKIVKSIIELDKDKQTELADLLDRVALGGLINIAKLIEYRYSKCEEFKRVIFDEMKSSYEVDVQKLVEDNLWMLEEGFHLIGAEEDKFETNLRNLLAFNKLPSEDVHLDHKDKNTEVDIFACRKLNDGNGIKHIVVELKRPTVIINNKCLQQIEKYIDVIQSDSRFLSTDSKWRFYLIGNKLDNKIESKIDSYKSYGEKDLVFIDPKTDFRGYALTWAQVFDRFELRHQYLKDEIDNRITSKKAPGL